MENILQKYEYKTIIQDNNSYLLHYKSKYYKIGKTIYEILNNSKKFSTIEEVSNSLVDKNITANQVSEIIKSQILPIFNKEENITVLPFMENYWWTGQLLSFRFASRLSKPLKPLFGKLFTYIFSLLLIANIILYAFNINLVSDIPSNNEFLQLVIIYFLLFFILLIHELGHIAASSTEKLKPQGIGFGLYFFMPMMYVNLTDAWTLSKKAKIKINLGGITTQMLINLALLMFLNISSNTFILGIVYKLLVVNTSIILINLIPFFKFDGYWILSDIVEIPNLLKESNNTFLKLFIKKSPFQHDNVLRKSFKKKCFLLVFTSLRLIFLFFVVLTVVMFVIHSLFKSAIFAMNIPYMEFSQATVIEVLKKVAILVIIFIILKKYCIAIFNLLRKNISK